MKDLKPNFKTTLTLLLVFLLFFSLPWLVFYYEAQQGAYWGLALLPNLLLSLLLGLVSSLLVFFLVLR